MHRNIVTTYFLNPILLIYGLEGIRLIIGEINKVFEIKPDPKVLDKWLPYLWSRDEMQADSLDRARNFLPSAFSQLRVPPPTFSPITQMQPWKKKITSPWKIPWYHSFICWIVQQMFEGFFVSDTILSARVALRTTKNKAKQNKTHCLCRAFISVAGGSQ